MTGSSCVQRSRLQEWPDFARSASAGALDRTALGGPARDRDTRSWMSRLLAHFGRTAVPFGGELGLQPFVFIERR
jgi:hypothetical protein